MACPSAPSHKGDPYQWQVEQSAAAIVEALAMPELEPVVCYQSRVGPLEWIGPATDAEIRRAGADGKGVVVAPIAFVSEHSETLVELDIEYRQAGARSRRAGLSPRAPRWAPQPAFIGGLAGLVRQAIARARLSPCGAGPRSVRAQFCRCAHARDD